ncbi:MAG: dTDP-4-dehydrorhamnose reductase [Elainella sp. Prado103]|jgi:dTDP-4-dehydrorhamnose reductase|nr:dTDP-4-dehydrorhamnose reductase [Elainella sp. Prado103]
MTRILLIGQDGQVGQELQRRLSPLGTLIGVGRSQLDLTQPEMIQPVIENANPDLIVNAAAYTAVDQAESEPEMAFAANGTAPGKMAEVAQSLGIPLLHISTDYVFDGSKNTPYLETDPTRPLGIYGKSKQAGEAAILAVADRHPDFRYVILRTAWVYGALGKGNFVKTMLRLGGDRTEVRVVADQVGTPTWAGEIAETLTQLTEKFLQTPAAPNTLSGIYHFTNSGVTSWYDFAVAIFEEAQSLGVPLTLQRVVPITTAEYPTPTQRPAYSALANQKIQALLGSIAPHWRQSLRQMLAELQPRQ